MKEFNELTALVHELTADAEKANNGNKAAATRLRVGMQNVKRLAHNVRLAYPA
jgi:Histone H1-like protein Hc1